jgi:hypothetical protein
MRNVARLKMGYYPLPESEGVKLRALLSFPQPASAIDPCVGQGTALHLLTGDAEVRRYGVELDAERARIATSKGIETIQGNAFDAIAKPESFSLLYLNPPYDSEIGSVANNRMERLFLDHTYRWLVSTSLMLKCGAWVAASGASVSPDRCSSSPARTKANWLLLGPRLSQGEVRSQSWFDRQPGLRSRDPGL